MPNPSTDHVAVIGLGLVGGSLFLRWAAHGAAVTGYDRDPAVRDAARGEVAAPAAVADSVAAAVAAADLVVVAVPLPQVAGTLDALAATGYVGLLTDVTSVKAPVRELVAARCPGVRWVGGHPMAGRETSGFAAADPGLVDGCAWVLCLEPATALADWLRVAERVTGLGARVVPATVDEHDVAVAAISHLPHLVAAALVAAAAEGPAGPLALSLAAGSFRDGTRVAATAPPFTAAMCGTNGAAVAAALGRFSAHLAEAGGLLAAADPVAALADWLDRPHRLRAAWPRPAGRPGWVPADVDALLTLGRSGGWVTAVDPAAGTVRVVRPD